MSKIAYFEAKTFKKLSQKELGESINPMKKFDLPKFYQGPSPEGHLQMVRSSAEQREAECLLGSLDIELPIYFCSSYVHENFTQEKKQIYYFPPILRVPILLLTYVREFCLGEKIDPLFSPILRFLFCSHICTRILPRTKNRYIISLYFEGYYFAPRMYIMVAQRKVRARLIF